MMSNEEGEEIHHKLPNNLSYVEGMELEHVGVHVYETEEGLWALSVSEEGYDAVQAVIEAHDD